jgi:hypothetical protein
MLNPATNKPKDKFNVFTRDLKDRLDLGQTVIVRLRDERRVELEWFVGTGFDEGVEYFCYRKNGCYLIWENDGISITSQDFDIMGSID